MRPIVSVIVPVYNAEKFLRPCLDSISGQTFQDYEAILVDDGSTDSSPVICDEYAGRDPRFRVIHQKNQGVSHARNAGLEAAAGEYVLFVDSDDAILPETIGHLYTVLKENKTCDIAAAGYTLVRTETGERTEYYVSSDHSYKSYSGIDVLSNMFYIGDTVWFTCWNKLISRSLIGSLRFEPIAQEDMLFNMSLYLRSSGIVYLNEALYIYYDWSESLTKNVSYIGTHKTVDVLWRLLQSVPEEDIDVRAMVYRKLYRRMLTASFFMKQNPDIISQAELKEQKSLHSSILKNSWKEYFGNKLIPLKDKVIFIAGRMSSGFLRRYLYKMSSI